MRPSLSFSFELTLVSILLAGCSSALDEKMDKIQVGMTYEEVENVVGKPTALLKGSSIIKTSAEGVDADSLLPKIVAYALNKTGNDTAKVLHLLKGSAIDSLGDEMTRATGFSGGIRSVDQAGQLIETAWEYEITKVETTYYYQKRDTVIQKSIPAETRTVRKYYLNGDNEIDLNSYLALRVGDWAKVYEGFAVKVSKGEFSDAIEVKSLEAKNRQIAYTSYTPHLESVKLKPNRIEQFTIYKYRIIFDSASGRVKSKGFQPVTVKQLQ